ncbi:hypothetical protein [Desulfonatronovibrio magnus]|uniref:hypothetical protein n=1 Tax=Desulfonatronovibrio magnus TaxID=698827 RepID=UPI000B1F743A|nr:hypothetical protein [Desulfonatronovibrio magnus]
MPISEKSMQFLEEHIPELAQSAVTQAYWQTLASGHSVLQSENGIVYEVFPDGTRTIVKKIAPPTPVRVGEKRVIRLHGTQVGKDRGESAPQRQTGTEPAG